MNTLFIVECIKFWIVLSLSQPWWDLSSGYFSNLLYCSALSTYLSTLSVSSNEEYRVVPFPLDLFLPLVCFYTHHALSSWNPQWPSMYLQLIFKYLIGENLENAELIRRFYLRAFDRQVQSLLPCSIFLLKRHQHVGLVSFSSLCIAAKIVRKHIFCKSRFRFRQHEAFWLIINIRNYLSCACYLIFTSWFMTNRLSSGIHFKRTRLECSS